nr:immunoglobulin light chain junction region [Macaca mulatta]MPO00462.1 immunoglobulin light chain junction region [Macaca mulatta]
CQQHSKWPQLAF